tara:strand:+ start:138 stop:476 length:339 start_codon:yes stop_codon:yes gene_type:complete
MIYKSSQNIERLFDEITSAIDLTLDKLDVAEKTIIEVHDDFQEQTDAVMSQAYPYLIQLCELRDTNVDTLLASGNNALITTCQYNRSVYLANQSSLREANEEAYHTLRGMYA